MNSFLCFLAALNFEVDGSTTLIPPLFNGRFVFVMGICVAFWASVLGLYFFGIGT